jgi:pSer/pThr/pTyr-binding forkhead associated (FHA) protein
MSNVLEEKCSRCGTPLKGDMCPACTVVGLDTSSLVADGDLSSSSAVKSKTVDSLVSLVDIMSNDAFPVALPLCKFGRDVSNDIIISEDKSISRFHLQIKQQNDRYTVEDLGSRNGTFLNGTPVKEARTIEDGDILSAGMSRFRFVVKKNKPVFR